MHTLNPGCAHNALKPGTRRALGAVSWRALAPYHGPPPAVSQRALVVSQAMSRAVPCAVSQAPLSRYKVCIATYAPAARTTSHIMSAVACVAALLRHVTGHCCAISQPYCVILPHKGCPQPRYKPLYRDSPHGQTTRARATCPCAHACRVVALLAVSWGCVMGLLVVSWPPAARPSCPVS